MNNTMEYYVSVIVSACVVLIFGSIAIDFYLYNKKQNIKHEKRSFVATGTMVLFYMVYVVLLKIEVGKLVVLSGERYPVILGILAVITGTIINIAGRMQLKGNWANHIKIYEGHYLVTNGVYAYVRHPLYSSIILMLYGGSVLYSSWLAALSITFVFIPFMIYRAKQEEKLLLGEFPEYRQYKDQAGMFLPKHLRRYKHV